MDFSIMSSTSGESFKHQFGSQSWEDVLQQLEDHEDQGELYAGRLWAYKHFETEPRDAVWDTVAAVLLYQAQSHFAHEKAFRIPMCGEDFQVKPTVLRASILCAVAEIEEVERCLQDAARILRRSFNSSRPYKIWTETGSRAQVDTNVVTSLHTAWGRPLATGSGGGDAESLRRSNFKTAIAGPRYVHMSVFRSSYCH